jgi:Flp pilus assembly protein TadB
MALSGARRKAISRTQALLAQDPRLSAALKQAGADKDKEASAVTGLQFYMQQADVRNSPQAVVFVSAMLTVLCGFFAAELFTPYFVPLLSLLGAALPFFWLEQRVRARAAKFSSDYPSVLLAAASSIKAGMTALAALERAITLLPRDSLVRVEVEKLLSALNRGVDREHALSEFGRTIRQADLELFRCAFALALENGGRFAPTLERLARVCRDREVLVRSAQVSTATMRMTANALIVIAPVILAMIAVRTDDFWELLVNHPTANMLASIGVMIIVGSFLILRRMSNFNP